MQEKGQDAGVQNRYFSVSDKLMSKKYSFSSEIYSGVAPVRQDKVDSVNIHMLGRMVLYGDGDGVERWALILQQCMASP